MLDNFWDWGWAVIALGTLVGTQMEILLKPFLHRVRTVWMGYEQGQFTEKAQEHIYAFIVRFFALIVALAEARLVAEAVDPWTNVFGMTDLSLKLFSLDLTMLVQIMPAAVIAAFFGKQFHDFMSWVKPLVDAWMKSKADVATVD